MVGVARREYDDDSYRDEMKEAVAGYHFPDKYTQKYDDRLPRVRLLSVKNETDNHFNSNILTDKVREVLTDGGKRAVVNERIAVTKSGWYTLRGIGNRRQFPIDDLYVVAETSPVYVYCGDQPMRSREDAEYFIRWIDDITRQADAHPGWRSERERKHVLDQFSEARRILQQR